MIDIAPSSWSIGVLRGQSPCSSLSAMFPAGFNKSACDLPLALRREGSHGNITLFSPFGRHIPHVAIIGPAYPGLESSFWSWTSVRASVVTEGASPPTPSTNMDRLETPCVNRIPLCPSPIPHPTSHAVQELPSKKGKPCPIPSVDEKRCPTLESRGDQSQPISG
ncbi:hypothetical protein S7711_11015 [Stachybotrys chartarum IBT 7711]|uniref:Uncharacterized protein n=1 Tax=Stachybotrys chartarum (strain CBS 109288 / IBT 7711) TaxID=1280523 RepID=A0A084AM99_STACB|nr:hypothetical protein S7711_11015 [Stachybotrys chartarum IBT 7711]KFA77147.1 hypothetical protein S40288_11015 [Stachybotrys chartarum IBT 40288]